jgi:predicted homoserine dehydrogenase-like protein
VVDIFVELGRRQRRGETVNVAVVGTGFFGAGLVRRLAAIPGMRPVVAANRTLSRAIDALLAAGFARAQICTTDDPHTAQAALDNGQVIATATLDLAARLAGVAVIMEATGDVLVGATLALDAIRHGKHFVAANVETQATVGPILKVLADEAGVVYSDVDGDEPGMLHALLASCRGMGFSPLVAGNFKGVLKRWATPATQAAFAQANNLQPWIATAAADGTKLNFELCTVANANGLPPAARGMVGPVTTSPETLLTDFAGAGLFEHGPIIDYALGGGRGVFVIAKSADPYVQQEFRYLKMGDGPYYLFHDPYVLVHYAAPLSAARAAMYGTPTVAPSGAPTAEVAAFAKRALGAGERLDGIGGADCYGMIVRADEVQEAGLLPIGLASYARLTRDIPAEHPIPLDAVTFEEENVVLALRRQQESHRWGEEMATISPALSGAVR